ncbi:ABC-2 transporter permease [Blautia sp.]|uniref:ABC-2 transporter permease n=1 Tax=Blautia sp. TaxID=1955243 RepID=UPI003AB7EDFB
MSFLLLAVGTVVAAVSNMFWSSGIEKGELMLSFETGVVIVLIPLQLKFGPENGRIIMVAVFMALFGVFYLTVKTAESSGVDVDQVMLDIQSLGIPVIAGVFIVFLGIASFISCLISIRIMERKEF